MTHSFPTRRSSDLKTTSDGKEGVIIELNCETDFVAKNADFVAFAEDIAALAIESKPASLEELLSLQLNGVNLSDRILDETGKIGEKIAVSTYETLSAPHVVAYIHGTNRIGVLVGLSADGAEVDEAGKDVRSEEGRVGKECVSTCRTRWE